MTSALRASLFLPLMLTSVLGAFAAPAEPRSQPSLEALDGEVIVRFKSGAGVLRQHTLAERADAQTVRDALGRRARTLGARWGRSLQAGAAVGARSQVLRATGVDAATLARQLAADPDVEYVVPNSRMRILTAPNDPLYAAAATGVRPRGPDSGQWYLRAPDSTIRSSLDIEAAWLRTTGTATVVVADIDTGVRPEHPDLAGRLLPGYDFVSDGISSGDGVAGSSDDRDADPNDPGDYISQADLNADAQRPASQRRFSGCSTMNSSWHGTGTIALAGATANNGVGMAGVAPGVRLLPVRAIGKCGVGKTSDIQAAMLWAAGISVPGVPDNPNPAKVINLSLGNPGSCSAAYQDAVDQVIARGVVVVASAGNSSGGPVGEPANCRGVIAVLALRHAGTKVGFSDLGPQIAIAAPGGNCVNTGASTPCLYPILTATDSGTQRPVSSSWTDAYNASLGTSYSSPLVAGVAALMFSAQPALTPAQLRSAMQSSARPFPTSGADPGSDGLPVTQCAAPVSGVIQTQHCYCTTALCGAGMVDAGAAVAAVAGAVAHINVVTAQPTSGSAVQLDATGSTTATGRSIVAWNWVLLSGGGIVTGFSSATNASSVSFTPSAAGSVTVQLTVTDSLGLTGQTQATVTVAAAAVTTPSTPAPAPSTGGGGGGGGAMSPPWLLALAVAVLALWRRGSGPG